MKCRIKITDTLLSNIHVDLHRRHPFAHERVGFITAGVARVSEGLMLFCRTYHPVADGDYEYSRSVGAQIGSNAMRNAIEAAYQNRSALIHVHTHGGIGQPEFSTTDLESAPEFVPGFFSALPRTPHGIVVLSNNSAQGLLWLNPKAQPLPVDGFVQVGAGIRKFGDQNEQA